MSCAHRVIRENSLAKIAQIDTRATLRDEHKYNSSRTPWNHHLVLNLPSSLLYRRRITRNVSRDHPSSMSALLDRFDAAEIFNAASIDATSVEAGLQQLQSHIAFDVMIEGLDQRFTDSITSEGCATSRLFLERTLARLPQTFGGVYSATMIVCNETPVRCEISHPIDPKARCLSLSCSVFVFARSTRGVKSSRCSTADSTRVRSWNVAKSATMRSRTDTASRLLLLLLLLSPLLTLQAREHPSTLLDRSSRSPHRTHPLQARPPPWSAHRSPAVHFSHSSCRQESTLRLNRIVFELRCQSRVWSRNRRLTWRLRRRRLQSRARLPLRSRVLSRRQLLLLLSMSRHYFPFQCPFRCHLPLMLHRLPRNRLYWQWRIWRPTRMRRLPWLQSLRQPPRALAPPRRRKAEPQLNKISRNVPLAKSKMR